MLNADSLAMALNILIARDILSWIFISAGAFFALTGALGILRFPEVFSRMHAAGIIDTLGMGLILIGLMFQADDWIVVVKLGLIGVFIFFTSPTTTFALARAALEDGLSPGPRKALPPSSKSAAPPKKEAS